MTSSQLVPETSAVRVRAALGPRSLIVWAAGFALFLVSEGLGIVAYLGSPTSVSGQLAPMFAAAVGLVLWFAVGIAALVVAVVALARPERPKWPALTVVVLTVGVPLIGVIAVAAGLLRLELTT